MTMTYKEVEAARLARQAELRQEREGEQRAMANGSPAPVDTPAGGDSLFDLSHDGLALDMGRRWQDSARHVAPWGRWMFWNGERWAPDEHLLHMTRTRDYLRERADGLVRDTADGKLQWGKATPEEDLKVAEAAAKNLRAAPMVANVVGLARSNAELAATVEQWDADPMALPMPKGDRDDHH